MWIRCAIRLVATVLVAGCGCSFVAVRRPPPAQATRDAPPECTQSRVAPALDTAGAIATPLMGLTLWGLCAFTSAMQSWSSDPKHLNCGLVLGGTILSTAAYTGSAVYGYRATADCRRLVEQRRTTSLRLETCFSGGCAGRETLIGGRPIGARDVAPSLVHSSPPARRPDASNPRAPHDVEARTP
jgi:hypothetical protein